MARKLRKTSGLPKRIHDMLDQWVEKRYGKTYARKSEYGRKKPRR